MPRLLNKTLYLPQEQNDFFLTVLAQPRELLALWLVLINLATFFIFGWDKFKAKYKEKHEHTRRVPEKTLFALAALGGSVGALLGMKVWRHKTLHRSFRLGIPVILILQILIPLGLWVYFQIR